MTLDHCIVVLTLKVVMQFRTLKQTCSAKQTDTIPIWQGTNKNKTTFQKLFSTVNGYNPRLSAGTGVASKSSF